MSILRPSILLDFANSQMLDPRATVARASGGTVQDPLGVWRERLANYPRYGAVQTTGERLGMLLEGQRTNHVTNPRGENAIAGTPGTVPSGWGSNATARTIHGLTARSGIALLDIEYTTAIAANWQLRFESATISAAPGDLWTASVFVFLQSGLISAAVDLEFRDSVGGLLQSISSAAVETKNVLHRVSIASLAPASTARVTAQIRFVASGATTFRAQYGAAQMELGAFASSLNLPAIGAPAASTRVADQMTLPLSAAGIAANGACTIFGDFMLPQPCPVGTNQTLLCLDDGSSANRYRLINVNGTAQIRPTARLANVDGPDVNAGSMTPGTPFRAVLRVDGAGNVSASLNGGAVVSTSGGPTSGLTTLRIGHDSAGAQNAFGWCRRVAIIPRVVTDAAMQLLSA